MLWLGLGIGFMFGAVIGFICAALCSISARRKDPSDHYCYEPVEQTFSGSEVRSEPLFRL